MPSLVEIKCRNSNELCRSSCSNPATPPALFLVFYNSCSNSELCPRSSSYAQDSTPLPLQTSTQANPTAQLPLTLRSYLYSCQHQLHAWGLCVTQLCAAMHSSFNKAAACCYKGMSFCSNQAVLVQTLPKALDLSTD